VKGKATPIRIQAHLRLLQSIHPNTSSISRIAPIHHIYLHDLLPQKTRTSDEGQRKRVTKKHSIKDIAKKVPRRSEQRENTRHQRVAVLRFLLFFQYIFLPASLAMIQSDTLIESAHRTPMVASVYCYCYILSSSSYSSPPTQTTNPFFIPAPISYVSHG
jgi:hypothetical protein